MIGKSFSQYQVMPVPWIPLQLNLSKDDASAKGEVSGKKKLEHLKQSRAYL